ncbi:hypothetical protein ACHAXS_011413 [Conticribra weissflogii]
MGKRGKSARKRRRENEGETAESTTLVTTLAESIVAKSAAKLARLEQNKAHCWSREDDDLAVPVGEHGISEGDLQLTIATLQKLSGLKDPSTNKLALKDKRYRSLRRILYDLQASVSGVPISSISNISLLASCGNGNFSASKITNEICQQIDHGAWEAAISSLRQLQKLQEVPGSQSLRPKLGALQRWVRQIDAAGTDDPLAVEVLDAMLRVVAPEAIIEVEKSDLENARWAKLGANNYDASKQRQGGSIRLFPAFDRSSNVEKSDGDRISTVKVGEDCIDKLVSSMQIGQDGIRRLTIPSLKEHRDKLFRTCGLEKGSDRKPPNKYDLEIVTTSCIEETLLVEAGNSNIESFSKELCLIPDGNIPNEMIVKTPLPYVRDSFLLENVLTPWECDRLVAAAEAAGYKPDEPLAGQPGASILAHACVWIVDHQLERELFRRVQKFLPTYENKNTPDSSSREETLEPLGINRRFRFYRYVPGRYYRPHIDGAWPPSGFDVHGNYRYDVFNKENKNGLQYVDDDKDETDLSPNDSGVDETPNNRRRQLSRLTFLVYLNDDFDGGYTTFLIPAKEKEGVLNAFPVKPLRGSILVFPHGSCDAPLHEGSPVLRGCKYVIRSEVEYFV